MTERLNGWKPDPGLLQDKVALVAGGGQGIGEATANILAAAGASVVVLDNDGDRALAVARAASESEGQAVPLVADLRDEGECARAIDYTVEHFGGLDILANVAGGMSRLAPWRPLREWDTGTWDAIAHLNLRYVFWLCRGAIPAMEARGGGAIVNVTSIAGSFGCPDQAPYGAAKAGLINLTKTLALECGALGIRVNAVSPGVVLTDAALATMKEETRATLSGITPLQRLGHPDDIARAVLFFSSPMAANVTGQTLLVDGGVSVRFPYPSLH